MNPFFKDTDAAILDSISRLNPVSLTLNDIYFKSVAEKDNYIKNTELILDSVKTGQYGGEATVYYDRLDLAWLKTILNRNPADDTRYVFVDSDQGSKVYDYLADINTSLSTEFTESDLINGDVVWPEFGPAIIRLTALPTSRTWKGEVEFNLYPVPINRFQVVLEIKNKANDNPYFFTTTGPVEDLVIDWGDGKGPGKNFAAFGTIVAGTRIGRPKTDLLEPGNYTVTVTGGQSVTFVRYVTTGYYITELIEYSSTAYQLTNLLAYLDTLTKVHPGAFKRCTFLETITRVFGQQSKIFEYPDELFAHLPRLVVATSVFVYGVFKQAPRRVFYGSPVQNAQYLFQHCHEMITAPGDVFAGNQAMDSLMMAFNNCWSLKVVGAGLLDNMPVLFALNNFMSQCTELEELPDNFIGDRPKLFTIGYMFSRCIKLRELKPGFLGKCPNLDTASYLCEQATSFTTIPDDLFAGCPKLVGLYWAFNGCPINRLPPTLFHNNPLLKDVRGTFKYTDYLKIGSLYKEIPDNFFANNPAITSYQETFYGCMDVKRIGVNALGTPTKCLDTFKTFYNAFELEQIPEDLLRGMTGLTSLEYMFGCEYRASVVYKLKNIPADMFVDQTNVNGATSLVGVFYNQRGVLFIPGGLFRKMTLYKGSIDGLFAGMTSATYVEENVFEGLAGITIPVAGTATAIGVFRGNILITNYPVGMVKYLPNITAFPLLTTDTGVTRLGTGFFAENTKFNNAYRLCYNSKVEFVSTDLFLNRPTLVSTVEAFYNCINLNMSLEELYPDTTYPKLTVSDQAHWGNINLKGSGVGFTTKVPVNNSHAKTFTNCTALNDYSSLPASWV